MCGRYSLGKKLREVAEALQVGLDDFPEPEFAPRYNIAPMQWLPVAVGGERPAWRKLRWGLVPAWARDEAFGMKCINARSETIQEKPSFRSLFRRRRALIPADGFFEWRNVEGRKEPHWFCLKTGEPFGLAGLWDSWERSPRAEALHTFTILTTTANELVAPFHDRMPVLIPPQHYRAWLGGEQVDPSLLASVLQPAPAAAMMETAVSPLINSVENDSPECVKSFVPPQLSLGLEFNL